MYQFKTLIDMRRKNLLLLVPIFLLFACSTPPSQPTEMEWAIVVHGGAGSLVKNEEMKTQYETHLLEAIQLGSDMLQDGASALDVAEAVVVYMENCPLFNAGKGAVKTLDGIHELMQPLWMVLI